MALLFLSLMICGTSPGWASGLDDLRAAREKSWEALGREVLGKGGNYDEAIALFTKAIESGEFSRDDLKEAYYLRGFDWFWKRDYDKAIADYTKAIEIDPKYPIAYNKLAWLMATCPDGRYRDGN